MCKPLVAIAALALVAFLGTALWLGVLKPGCVHEQDVIDSVTPDTWPRCPTE